MFVVEKPESGLHLNGREPGKVPEVNSRFRKTSSGIRKRGRESLQVDVNNNNNNTKLTARSNDNVFVSARSREKTTFQITVFWFGRACNKILGDRFIRNVFFQICTSGLI